MTLMDLIHKRLRENPAIRDSLTCFAGVPGVFTPEAPADTAKGWGMSSHYPRIVFAADLSANEERKCQGNMVLSIYAENTGEFDFNSAVSQVIECLCGVLLTPEGKNPYVLAWNRTDGFALEGTNIAGQELQFDILEYPSQETTDPDPVDGVNAYLKELFPRSLVLWQDRFRETEELSGNCPVFYCRLETLREDAERSTFAVAWMDCRLSIHIFCTDSNLRRKYSSAVCQRLAIDGEICMLDNSPFLIWEVSQDQSPDYLRVGQVKVSGRFGILRQTEKKKRIREIQMDYRN